MNSPSEKARQRDLVRIDNFCQIILGELAECEDPRLNPTQPSMGSLIILSGARLRHIRWALGGIQRQIEVAKRRGVPRA